MQMLCVCVHGVKAMRVCEEICAGCSGHAAHAPGQATRKVLFAGYRWVWLKAVGGGCEVGYLEVLRGGFGASAGRVCKGAGLIFC